MEVRTLPMKTEVRRRCGFLALAVAFLLLPFSSYQHSRAIDGREVYRMEWAMVGDDPWIAGLCVALGICCLVLRMRYAKH